jgi:hypothetical protein
VSSGVFVVLLCRIFQSLFPTDLFYSLPCLTIYATCFENLNVDLIIVILFIEKYRKSENKLAKDFGEET